MTRNPATIAEAFQATLDLFETGLAIMRQNLRRADPQASEQEIDRRLSEWLHNRPPDCAHPTVRPSPSAGVRQS